MLSCYSGRTPGVHETSERGLPPGQGRGDPRCWGARLRRGTGQEAPPGAPWSPALITFHLGLHVGPSVHLFLEGYFIFFIYFTNDTIAAKPCPMWVRQDFAFPWWTRRCPERARGRAARRVVTHLSTAPCQCSRMNPDSRKNCGFPGITSEQCFATGCCFDTTVPGVPWCFTPLPMQGNRRAAGPPPVPAARSPGPS